LDCIEKFKKVRHEMEIRNATEADAVICNDFYNRQYGYDRTREQWLWEFSYPNPGERLPYILAFDAGNLVGTQAYITTPMIDELGTFVTAKSEETLVAPSMRGRDVLTKMYDLLFAQAAAEQCQSIWGFTPAERAFRKLGFEIPTSTGQLVKALTADSLSKLVESAQGPSGTRLVAVYVKLGSLFARFWSVLGDTLPKGSLKDSESLVTLSDESYFDDDYSRRFINNWGGATIYRSQAYMKWRIFDNPFSRANVLGIVESGILIGHVAFMIDRKGVGYIVDILTAHPMGRRHDKRLLHILLKSSIKRLKRLGATSIRAWTLNDHPLDREMRKASYLMGFIKIPRGSAVVFKTNFHDTREEASRTDFSDWYVTRLFSQGTTG
jgi:GNAT superfamily N-acetyltransferase